MRLLIAVSVLVAAPAASAQAAPTFGFEEAMRIGSAAVRDAKAQGRPISVVVVNREGRVLVALRTDDSSFMNLEVAQAKAVSAAALGAPTMAIEQAVEGGKSSFLSVPGLSAIGGGIPVARDGEVVAGVGVSSGTPQQDQAIAEAAIATKGQ